MNPTRLVPPLPMVPMVCVLACAFVAGGCSMLGVDESVSSEARVTRLEAVPGGTLERRFAVTLVLQNPDVEPLLAQGLAFHVDLAGTRVSYDVARKFTIPPGEELTLDVTATSLSLDAYRRILELRGSGSVRYSLRGRISRGAWSRPLRFRGSGSFEAAPAP
ncbi:MAG: LEA type 2 family protein [Myxococcota bacterium]|nr:LEA type 2 family protein [Myxococcota bacterium]